MNLYGKIYRNILWPIYENVRGRRTHRLLKLVEKNQWKRPEELAEFQLSELQSLLHHTYKNSRWYRSRFEERGIFPSDIRTTEDFAKLPLVSREDIRRNRDTMLCGNYKGRVFEHKTGGSTGVPLQFYMTRESYEWRNAVSLRGYGWAGATEGTKAFYLWSMPADIPPLAQRLKASLHQLVIRHRFFNSFRLSRADLPICLESLNNFSPKVLVGYSHMLELLARYIQKHGGLRVKLKSVITAAEGVTDSQRQLLREVFEAPVFASYGCREFKLIAMECEQQNFHINSDNLLVECLHRGEMSEEGALGEVVITDLHNLGMPFIRYRLGDLASRKDKMCSCGRGLPLFESVQGRIADTIQTPDGRLVSGLFFPHLLKEFHFVEQFQVKQPQLDELVVKLVVSDREKYSNELSRIESQIRSVVGNKIRISFNLCNDIPCTSTGKRRVVVSEIPVEI